MMMTELPVKQFRQEAFILPAAYYAASETPFGVGVVAFPYEEAAWPRAAARPNLDCAKTVFKIALPSWNTFLQEALPLEKHCRPLLARLFSDDAVEILYHQEFKDTEREARDYAEGKSDGEKIIKDALKAFYDGKREELSALTSVADYLDLTLTAFRGKKDAASKFLLERCVSGVVYAGDGGKQCVIFDAFHDTKIIEVMRRK
jgi:hypothetical protein